MRQLFFSRISKFTTSFKNPIRLTDYRSQLEVFQTTLHGPLTQGNITLADWLHFTGYACEDDYDSATKDISCS